MKKRVNKNLKSFWLNSYTKPILFKKLNKNISTDVVIIGGGIAGTTIAYFLSKKGRKITLIEANSIGSGETENTTAHLTYALDNMYSDLIKIHGKEKTKKILESHKKAIDTIEEITKKEKINCNFERVDGYLIPSKNNQIKKIKNELEVLKKLGDKIPKLTKTPLKNFSDLCIKFTNQGQFHPLKYINGLTKLIIKNKGKIYTQTFIEKIENRKITTNKGFKINAKKIIICTNSPIILNEKIENKQKSYISYAIASKIPKNSMKKSLYWDTGKFMNIGNPYHYIRLQEINKKEDLLIIGGEDTKISQATNPEKKYKNLEKWTRKKFPFIKKIDSKWSGQILESKDGIAIIGKIKNNHYIATGFSGTGMTYSIIAGKLITNLILNKNDELERIYNPLRF